MLTGTLLASLGLFVLKAGAAVTGGTAGVALLLSYLAPLPFGVLFFLVNVPFFALALWKKGVQFTLRTALAVVLVGVFSAVHPMVMDLQGLNPVYAVLVGNLLAGVGLLILFRHRASLGGFSILALVLQERLGWRAGYVQMALDVAVVTAAAVGRHSVRGAAVCGRCGGAQPGAGAEPPSRAVSRTVNLLVRVSRSGGCGSGSPRRPVDPRGR